MMQKFRMLTIGLGLCALAACGGDDPATGSKSAAGGASAGGGAEDGRVVQQVEAGAACRAGGDVGLRLAASFQMGANAPKSCLIVDFGPEGGSFDGFSSPDALKLIGVITVPGDCEAAKARTPGGYMRVRSAAGQLRVEADKATVSLRFDVGAPHLIRITGEAVSVAASCGGSDGKDDGKPDGKDDGKPDGKDDGKPDGKDDGKPDGKDDGDDDDGEEVDPNEKRVTELSACRASDEVPLRVGGDYTMMGIGSCVVLEFGPNGKKRDGLTTPDGLSLIRVATAAGSCADVLPKTLWRIQNLWLQEAEGSLRVHDNQVADVNIRMSVGAPHPIRVVARGVAGGSSCTP